MRSNFYLLTFIILTLTSCEPGFGVIISNKSNTDRIIKVIKVDKLELKYKNSLSVADTSSFDFSSPKVKKVVMPLITKDTSKNYYTFFLDKGKRASIQGGIGGIADADLSQEIIVADQDTVFLKSDKRVKFKTGRSHSEIEITIE